MFIKDPSRRKILKSDNRWLLNLTIRPLGNYLAVDIFSKTSVTPTNITILSFILALAASILFSFGEYVFLIFGSFLVFISKVLDSTDGQLARYKGIESKIGNYLDKMLDAVKEFILVISLCIGHYRVNAELDIWILGFTAFFVMIMGHYNARLFNLIFPIPIRSAGKIPIKKTLSNRILKNLKKIPLLLNFGFGEKLLYISLFTLLNQIKWLMILSIALGFFRMVYDPIQHIRQYNRIPS